MTLQDPTPNNSGFAAGHSFGELLRRLREQRGLTQNNLADRAGLSEPTLGRAERMLRCELRPSNVAKIARALQPMSDADSALWRAATGMVNTGKDGEFESGVAGYAGTLQERSSRLGALLKSLREMRQMGQGECAILGFPIVSVIDEIERGTWSCLMEDPWCMQVWYILARLHLRKPIGELVWADLSVLLGKPVAVIRARVLETITHLASGTATAETAGEAGKITRAVSAEHAKGTPHAAFAAILMAQRTAALDRFTLGGVLAAKLRMGFDEFCGEAQRRGVSIVDAMDAIACWEIAGGGQCRFGRPSGIAEAQTDGKNGAAA